MSLLSWNCRGLGNPRTVREVGKMVHRYNPRILFLIETKKKATEMERCRIRWGFDCCLAVDSCGKGGGLAVLWNNDFLASIISYSKHHIDLLVTDDGGDWRITFFYGHPETSKRADTWNLLKRLNDQMTIPWICIGDYNEILCDGDKNGGATRPDRQLEAFREVVSACNFQEIPVVGPFYTWSRGLGTELIEIRLDRALANFSWISRFHTAMEEHIVNARSDHLPILIHLSCERPKKQLYKKKEFKFENMWCRDERCAAVVENAWMTSGDVSVLDRIARCGKDLSTWNSEVFGNVNTNISNKTKELQHLLNKPRSPTTIQAINKCRRELNEWYMKEETMWKQRVKDFWIKEDDRNSRYFHQTASGKRKNNRISGVMDSFGNMLKDPNSIENCFFDYFSNIFSSEGVNDMEVVFNTVKSRLSEEDKKRLEQPFVEEEIVTALKSMDPYKDAGPDGMNPNFFQKHWGIVGKDVVDMILGFLNNGEDIPDCNQTNIALVPKKKSSQVLGDFRPISLCNVVYKLISKTIANRMKGVLVDLISPNQSAFVPGRLIFDNTMVAYETIHTMRKKATGGKGLMAIKLDMAKAYDRVEWPFLEGMMKTMGFSDHWTSLVMGCVTTVSYSVLINNKRCGAITPTRGHR